jgi:TM2 domain-containing membrane protein YozV
MDDKFYLQLNLVNIITIFLMWLIVAVVIGFVVTAVSKRGDNTASS